jgi:hypothetical protein
VEQILQSRKQARKLQYQVKWVGVDYNPVFYDTESFKGALYKLKAFHDKYPKTIGPLVNLLY